MHDVSPSNYWLWRVEKKFTHFPDDFEIDIPSDVPHSICSNPIYMRTFTVTPHISIICFEQSSNDYKNSLLMQYVCSYRSIFHIRYSHVIILQLSMGVFMACFSDIFSPFRWLYHILTFPLIDKVFHLDVLKRHVSTWTSKKKCFNKMTLLMTWYSSSSVKALSMILCVCV